MARGFVYTDTDILKLFEAHGPLTIDDVIAQTDMARSTAYQRVERLRKQGHLVVTKSIPSDNGGRPAKVYSPMGKHRPSIINEKSHLKMGVDCVSPEDLGDFISWVKEVNVSNQDVDNRRKLFRSFWFPRMAKAVMLLRSREHRTQYLVQRDALVTEGEELIEYLKRRINAIEEVIYSPEFRDPYESNFTNICEDYHQWGYDHLVEYKPIVFSEAVREAYDSGHLLESDYESSE